MKAKSRLVKYLATSLILFLYLIVLSSPILKVQALSAASVPKNVKFETIVSDLDDPVFVTHSGDGSGRLFIIQRNGIILVLKNGELNQTPFLDVRDIITTDGNEQGLLGLAFDPNYTTTGRFYVVYTVATNNAVRLARYHVSETNPDIAEAGGTVLLSIDKPYQNHNGGTIAFGPDGYLYMTVGDGGGGDPNNNAQNKNSLLGKVLRLNVSGSTYSIPASNPFKGDPNVQEEVWAYGLRNPWRFSFDRTTGDIYIGDVGQQTQEEINFQPATSLGGENYGWRILEGDLCYNAMTCTPPMSYAPPVAVYSHGPNNSLGCSVTGGYVYRGTQFPSLVGVYIYGDFCHGKLWGMIKNENNEWVSILIADTSFRISSFGENEDGEIYLIDYATGSLLHIVEATINTTTFISEGIYDGFILESSKNNGAGSAINTSNDSIALGDNSANRQYAGILSFDTSGLPNNAVIVSVKLKIKQKRIIGINPFNTHGNLVADIRMGNFSTSPNLESADFAASANRNNVIRFTNNVVNGWYTRAMSPAGILYISHTGNTQFRLRFTTDDDNDFVSDILRFFSGDASTANRPKLIVKYYVP